MSIKVAPILSGLRGFIRASEDYHMGATEVKQNALQQ